MKLVRIIAELWVIGALLGARCPTCAEEIILKNGQKIVGTIVGYEKDMFRVETDYGIALVRKDKVASIQVSQPDAANPQAPPPPTAKTIDVKPASVAAAPAAAPAPAPPPPTPAKPPGPAKLDIATTTANPQAPPPLATKTIDVKPVHVAAVLETAPTPAPPPPAPAKPVAATAIPQAPQGPATKTIGEKPTHIAAATETARAPAPPSPAPATPPAPAPVVAPPAKPPAPPPTPVSHPLDVPMPAHLQEHVDGNTYFSDTFQFSMFKPPDWKIYEGVPKETGSGIMAMGTEDEQTLLIVDRQVWSGIPKLTSDQVEAGLRQTYQDYRRISEDAFECDGQTATRRTFTGVLDGAEWHGMEVNVIHGNMAFGIIGLTSAETFQFQEAIFNKIIKTFHFLTPAASTAGLPNP